MYPTIPHMLWVLRVGGLAAGVRPNASRSSGGEPGAPREESSGTPKGRESYPICKNASIAVAIRKTGGRVGGARVKGVIGAEMVGGEGRGGSADVWEAGRGRPIFPQLLRHSLRGGRRMGNLFSPR